MKQLGAAARSAHESEAVVLKLFIEPQCQQWSAILLRGVHHDGSLFGKTMAEWKAITRDELGLATNRPIVATGHQTLLWHPGILAKYMAVDAFARQARFDGMEPATANLIVDQHADGFGAFDIPVRKSDGALDTTNVKLTEPRAGVPMGLHAPFTPESRANAVELHAALPSVSAGVKAIFIAVSEHNDAPNAALQMAGALDDLMSPWVRPMPSACASQFVHTEFGRALLRRIVDDPQSCARLYNKAVAAIPEAGIGPLLVRDDYVELPLWRITAEGARVHAYDNDVEALLEGDDIKLMPRALFMTALLRLVVCDLFVHGRGGANYDRAMELWVRPWLGVDPCPIAVVSADIQLPLRGEEKEAISVDDAIREYRTLWHDPADGGMKREYINKIESAPRRSTERKKLFFEMHEKLEELRDQNKTEIESAAARIDQARRDAADCAIARRRDWAFSLYPGEAIDSLAAAVGDALGCGAGFKAC